MDPKKTQHVREWKEYQSCSDITSHLECFSYLRKYFGPDWSTHTKHLRVYTKKGVDFSLYKDGSAAQDARKNGQGNRF